MEQPLAGEAELRNAGGGRFVLATPDGELKCEGFADPPDSSSARTGCGDQSGTGTLRCSDGTSMRIFWKAITCRAFEGIGTDRHGKTWHFSVTKAPF